MFHSILCVISILVSANVMAEMYKCEAEGETLFQARPCRSGHQTILVEPKRAEQSFESVRHEEGDLRIGPFITKVNYQDSSGKRLVYKIRVTNNSDTEVDVNLLYHAIDREGFYVKSAHVTGLIPANTYRDLTNQIFLRPQAHRRVYKWVFVKRIETTRAIFQK